MDKTKEEEILARYRAGNASAEEKQWVEDWILNGIDFDTDLSDEELLEDLTSLRRRMHLDEPERKNGLWKKYAVAASIILVSILSLLLFKINKTEPHKLVAQKTTEIKAGQNIATLTLSDGSTILLDSTIGHINEESGIKIENDADGNITYIIDASDNIDSKLSYNTISTPKGGTYKIILPDGSKVWLNAASSLRFPLLFTENERRVKLTGEGYFEVAKSNKRFSVEAHNTTVEVLGTHFNINGYTNEKSTSVTLLEGSVKMTATQSSVVLKPGEQGELTGRNAEIHVNQNIDTESVTSWKDGKFKFNNTDLKTIMRQLERWYDIEIDESSIPNKKFNGTISRDVKLAEVLSMIELTSDINFVTKGRSVSMK